MGLVVGKMPASSESREDFSLSKHLVRLSNKGGFFDGYAAMDSTLVLGTKGVGKTSAVVATIGRSILQWRGSRGNGSGGLVVTGTTEAKDDFLSVAKAAGRLDDVIIVRPGEHRFAFLSYIAGWGGDESFYVENVLQMLSTAAEIVRQDRQAHGGDPFWEAKGEEWLRCLIWIDWMAHRSISLHRILEMIQSLPKNLGALDEPERLASLRYLQLAEQNAATSRAGELKLCRDWLTIEIPLMAEKTKSSVAAVASLTINKLLWEPASKLFSGESTVTPEDSMRGKWVVIDVSVMEHDVVGRIVNVIFYTMWAKALQRRMKGMKGRENEVRPVCLWADEAHLFITKYWETLLATCRSSRIIILNCSQTIEGLQNQLGGESAKSRVENIVNLHSNRIFCRNLSARTNAAASESIGKEWVRVRTAGVSMPQQAQDRRQQQRPGQKQSENAGFSWQQVFSCPPEEFLTLRRGAPDGSCMVEAIVVLGGKRFRFNGKRFLRVRFNQVNWGTPHDIFSHRLPTAFVWATHVTVKEVWNAWWRGPEAFAEVLERWIEFWVGNLNFIQGRVERKAIREDGKDRARYAL